MPEAAHNKPFRLTILGSSAATPTSLRHTTAQVLMHYNRLFLLDCAEGTQMQLRRLKLPMMRIAHIFISHLHGDHYLGLPGLLFSMHLLGRTQDLHVYAPPGLSAIIDMQFSISGMVPQYRTFFHEIREGRQRVYQDDFLEVETLAMDHRIPCYGFLFREKPLLRNIRKESIGKYRIPVGQMQDIKRGLDFVTRDGRRIPNQEITLPPPAPRTYAFCSDTAYTEQFLDQVKGVDLLYHEATFLQDMAEVAREKKHATTAEAATLARKAGACRLMLGHYSARYRDTGMFLKEAREIFPDTILAEEGMQVDVRP